MLHVSSHVAWTNKLYVLKNNPSTSVSDRVLNKCISVLYLGLDALVGGTCLDEFEHQSINRYEI
jgi:hypothetical protein